MGAISAEKEKKENKYIYIKKMKAVVNKEQLKAAALAKQTRGRRERALSDHRISRSQTEESPLRAARTQSL